MLHIEVKIFTYGARNNYKAPHLSLKFRPQVCNVATSGLQCGT